MPRDDKPPLSADAQLEQKRGDDLERASEPPIVARLVVEIRSDGSRTIARGALEDTTLGERVAMRAEGATPLALAAKLATSLLKAPLLGRTMARALLAGKKRTPPGK